MMKNFGSTVVLLALAFWSGSITGCATTVRYGSPPKVDQLASLKPGISNTDQVRLALGDPRGYGMARLTLDPTPRKIWFYEYSEASGSRVDLKFLVVFFRQEEYEGHFWFSSANLMEMKR